VVTGNDSLALVALTSAPASITAFILIPTRCRKQESSLTFFSLSVWFFVVAPIIDADINADNKA